MTPFIALLEARQPGLATADARQQPVQMHYCTRDAARDALLARLQTLCAQAEPKVGLTVHDAARGQRLTPRTLEALGGPLDIWFCGPQGLGEKGQDRVLGHGRAEDGQKPGQAEQSKGREFHGRAEMSP